MPHHIDVISNKPLAGRQKLLARVWAEHDDVVFDAGDDGERGDHILKTLQQIVPAIDRHEDPESFIAAVQERVDSTHLALCMTITNAHSETWAARSPGAISPTLSLRR